MEPINLCKDDCELSPLDCGFYNVDTDECNKELPLVEGNSETTTDEVTENVEIDNTVSEGTGDSADAIRDDVSDESVTTPINDGTTLDAGNNEADDTTTQEDGAVVEQQTPVQESTDTVVVEEEQVADNSNATTLKKAELFPEHKDDPNYYYDGQSGVYKEKDPNFNYNADGTITQKSANEN